MKDNLKRRKQGDGVTKVLPSSTDMVEVKDLMTDKKGPSTMKSNVNVGGRSQPIQKEPKESTNAQMKYPESVNIKDKNLKSSGMMPPQKVSENKQKAEKMREEKLNQKLEEFNKREEKRQQILNAKNQSNNKVEDKPINPNKPKEAKSKNQQKLEELQKKLIDVQIRMKNTGLKIN